MGRAVLHTFRGKDPSCGGSLSFDIGFPRRPGMDIQQPDGGDRGQVILGIGESCGDI